MDKCLNLFLILGITLCIDAKDIEPRSETRYGYGMLYDYQGHMYHGLNRYYLMVGMQIPDLRVPMKYMPPPMPANFCNRFDERKHKVLYQTCMNTWPAYLNGLDKIKEYQQAIDEIMTTQIPAVIPGYNVEEKPPEFKLSKHTYGPPAPRSSRSKRFVMDLINLGINGYNAYSQHRKMAKMEKGMKILVGQQKVLKHEIKAVRDDMMSLATATLSELDALKSDLHGIALEVKNLAYQLANTNAILDHHEERINDNSNAILFLSTTMTLLMVEVEKYLTLYERVMIELDHLLDALDNLSNNLLSHSVIKPADLKRMIEHVKQQLHDHFPDYSLVIDKVHEYYNLPLIHFAYQSGVIGIQIPLFVKPRLQEPLTLFDVRTVPVPVHVNPKLIDEHESPHAYTKVIPSTEIVAMSSDTYINIQHRQLKQCFKFSVVYFCEQMFIMKHHSEHTCESAIYHYEEPQLIKDKCNIQYYPELHPEPEILDAGSHLLLSNLPLPWTIRCGYNDQIPNPLIGGSYVILHKTDLCQCSISAGTWYIQENLVYCEDGLDTRVTLYYTVNMAVSLYQFEEKIQSGEITDVKLMTEPVDFDPWEPKVVSYEDKTVLQQTVPAVPLSEAMERMEEERYATKQDKALAETDMLTWFNGENDSKAMLVVGAVIAIALVPAVFFVMIKFFGLRISFAKTSTAVSRLTKLVAAQQALNTIPGAHASTIIEYTGVDYFAIYLRVFLGTCALMVVYKMVSELIRYWPTSIMNRYSERYMFWKTLAFDRTEISIQFQNCNSYVCAVTLGSVLGPPESIELVQSIEGDSINLDKHCIYDFLDINWGQTSLYLDDMNLYFPNSFIIPLCTKWVMRKIFQDPHAKFRFLAHNIKSTKTRPLNGLQDLFPIKYAKLTRASTQDEISQDSAYSSLEDAVPQELPPIPIRTESTDSVPYLGRLFRGESRSSVGTSTYIDMRTSRITALTTISESEFEDDDYLPPTPEPINLRLSLTSQEIEVPQEMKVEVQVHAPLDGLQLHDVPDELQLHEIPEQDTDA